MKNPSFFRMVRLSIVALMMLLLASHPQSIAGPITKLVWATQPGNATGGQPFGTQPVLKTADAVGTPSTQGLPDLLYVTVNLSSGTGPLTGTVTHNIGTSGDNGVVNFTDLQIGSTGNGAVLTASIAPVPGAALWVDADDLTKIATNGSGGVTGWTNKGTAGGRMVVPPNWTPPILTANSMNGRPAVRFNPGAVNNNSLSNRWSPALDAGSEITFFMALRNTANRIGNWDGVIGFANATAQDSKNNATLGYDCGYSDTGFRIVRNDLSGSPGYTLPGQFTQPNFANGIGANFNFAALGSWYNQRAGNGTNWVNVFYQDSGGNGADYWVDQFNNTWTNFQTTTVTVPFNITDVALGARLDQAPGDQVNWPSRVDFGEVLVYASALSDADRAATQTYLNGKWLTNPLYANAVSQPFNVSQAGANRVVRIVDNGNGTFTLTFSGTPGVQYYVQAAATVAPAMSWTALTDSTNTAAIDGSWTYTASGGSTEKYFRAARVTP